MDPQLLIVNNKMHLICPILHLFYAASQQSNPGFRRAAAPALLFMPQRSAGGY
jgi:hypothetical protein